MEVYTRGLTSSKSDDQILDEIYWIRRRVFVDRLGWNLAIDDRGEIDEFDGERTTYGVLYEDGIMVGSFRFIPMNQPNMCSHVFQDVIPVKFPNNSKTLELSRFCLNPSFTLFDRRTVFGAIKKLVRFAGDIAIEMEANKIYSLSEVRFAKVLVASGVHLRRLSSDFMIAGKPCGVGDWDPTDSIGQKRQRRIEDVRIANRLAA